MRDVFHDELDAIDALLVSMAEAVRDGMNGASAALTTSDLCLAEQVISGDARIDAMRQEVERRALAVMATQQPVARDLRALITSLRVVMDLERMGDLAVHVAKLARHHYPDAAIAPQLDPIVRSMGEVADSIALKCGHVLATADLAAAAALEHDDDAMDELHRRLLQVLLSEQWEGTVEDAINATLCGRFYERFADHAVNIGTRLLFQATGRRSVPTAARWV